MKEDEKVNLIKLKCDNCGASLKVNTDLNEFVCNYCGAKVLIDDEASNITRVEKAKLNAIKEKHEQEVKAAEDKINIWKKRFGIPITEEEKNEHEKKNKKVLLINGIIWGCMILFIVFVIILSDKNPSLESFHKLEIGMSYEECKNILGVHGHLIFEEEYKTTYVWYNVYCESEHKDENGNCPVIIELNFENNKLVNRKEKGLE